MSSPAAPPAYELTLPACMSRCDEARAFVVRAVAPVGFTQLDLFQIELAVDEAFINAADHGSHCDRAAQVVIRVTLLRDGAAILVRDHGGKPFDPVFFERLADKKTWGAGGRGIKIIKEIMDEVMYVFLVGVSTTLYMVKRASAPAAAGAPPAAGA